jgi:hypothetical protein
LLTMKIRHGFPGRNSCRRYGDTKGGDSEWGLPRLPNAPKRDHAAKRGHPVNF